MLTFSFVTHILNFNDARASGEYDMRNLMLLVMGCLVIAAELEATKKIEEMNQRAQIRAEAVDCESWKPNEKTGPKVGQHRDVERSG
jgi:hypothetical protein